jgi:alpha-tubulin suppressor-like RCC1 family protein
MTRSSLIVVAMLVVGCYSPPGAGNCEVQCAAGSEACPEGLTCHQGFCARPGETPTCGPTDAAADAPDDGGNPPGAALSGLAAGGAHTCGIDADRRLWCWGNNTEQQLSVAVDPAQPIRAQAVEVVVGGVTGWKKVAAGTNFTCAIDDLDELYCWGSDNYGQLGRDFGGAYGPPEIVDDSGLEGASWDFLALGGAHTCGIRDGRLYCWGQNQSRQVGNDDDQNVGLPARIGTDTDWIQVAAEGNNTCGVRDGAGGRRVYCWGRPEMLGDAVPGTDHGTPDKEIVHPEGGTRRLQQVAVGSGFGCAIDDLQDLYCWGYNDSFQQGDASGGFVPTLSDDTLDWDEIHAFTGRACGLAGTALYCWGVSDYGEVGVRAAEVPRADPVPGDWVEVATGHYHTCGVTTAGEAMCWGNNGNAELGTGVIGDGLTLQQVMPGSTWAQVAAAYTSTCAIALSDRSIWCWGVNTYGSLGLPGDSATPRRLDAQGTGWKKVATVGWHACAIGADDTMTCWGGGGWGQLGTGSDVSDDPTQVGSMTWLDVGVGDRYTCGIAGNGTLWCWGGRVHGCLGDGSEADQVDTPLQITTTPGQYDRIAVGQTHACAIRAADGAADCWGWNFWNAVDESATEAITTPNPITALGTGWAQLGAGGEYYTHSCGINTANAYCWGAGYGGRLGLGDTNPRITPTQLTMPAPTGWEAISPGGPHTCALREGGQLYCWGDGLVRPLANGTLGGSFQPVRIGTGVGWKQVDSGTYHACAIDSADALWCWGDNSGLQLGSGLGLTHVPQPVTVVPAR